MSIPVENLHAQATVLHDPSPRGWFDMAGPHPVAHRARCHDDERIRIEHGTLGIVRRDT